MIWNENVSVVAMLARLIEHDKPKVSQYWPNEKEVPKRFGKFQVTLIDEEIKRENTTRRMQVELDGSEQKKIVTQLHYTAWVRENFLVKMKT